MKFGERLRVLRQERSMTQADLAKSIGVSPAAISRYESGERTRFSIPTIIAMATALHVTWQELVYGTEIENITANMMNNRSQKYNDPKGQAFFNGVPVTSIVTDEDCKTDLLHAFEKLNSAGKIEATKRIIELSELSKYRLK